MATTDHITNLDKSNVHHSTQRSRPESDEIEQNVQSVFQIHPANFNSNQISRSEIIRLQRLIGNQAVQRLISRKSDTLPNISTANGANRVIQRQLLHPNEEVTFEGFLVANGFSIEYIPQAAYHYLNKKWNELLVTHLQLVERGNIANAIAAHQPEKQSLLQWIRDEYISPAKLDRAIKKYIQDNPVNPKNYKERLNGLRPEYAVPAAPKVWQLLDGGGPPPEAIKINIFNEIKSIVAFELAPKSAREAVDHFNLGKGHDYQVKTIAHNRQTRESVIGESSGTNTTLWQRAGGQVAFLPGVPLATQATLTPLRNALNGVGVVEGLQRGVWACGETDAVAKALLKGWQIQDIGVYSLQFHPRNGWQYQVPCDHCRQWVKESK